MIALGVILFGVCAALPFRQPLPVRQVGLDPPVRIELPLRKADVPVGLLQADASPASDLSRQAEQAAPLEAPRLTRSTPGEALANVAPPPALPISFQPIGEDLRPTSWKPTAPPPVTPPQKLRPYRLRDGDTLERLAERYLGDRGRAEEIFAGNRHVLARPDLLPVGVEILLPPRQPAAAK